MILLNKSRPQVAAQFILPLIGYSEKSEFDVNFVLEHVFRDISQSECPISEAFPNSGQSKPENEWTLGKILMINNPKWPMKEQIWMINFLCTLLEDKGIINLESVMETLVMATRTYPKACQVFKERVVERCWIMMDSEINQMTIEKLAYLSASFLSLIEYETSYEKELQEASFNDKINCDIQKVLFKVIHGITAAIRLD